MYGQYNIASINTSTTIRFERFVRDDERLNNAKKIYNLNKANKNQYVGFVNCPATADKIFIVLIYSKFG